MFTRPYSTETSLHHPTIFICVQISLHDANLPEQLTMGVGFAREQVVIMIVNRACIQLEQTTF